MFSVKYCDVCEISPPLRDSMDRCKNDSLIIMKIFDYNCDKKPTIYYRTDTEQMEGREESS